MRAALPLVGLLVLGPLYPGMSTPPERVIDPPQPSADRRLHQLYHLDNPAPFRPEFTTAAAWEQRAARLREQLLVSQGLWPLPPKAPLSPTIHGKIAREGYTIEKVYFVSFPGHYVCGNLYRPTGKPGRLPAVLMPHGHHANGRFNEASANEVKRELASGAEQTTESARYPLQARCAMLARLGCVVFHYDMVGYADSQAIPHRAGFADAWSELRGQSAMGLQTWNSIRALDFLLSLPDVDPARVGVTGASGGGTQTFILCAIDPRPRTAFPAVMVSMNMQGGCICENASHLRVGTNNVEIAALAAPRPVAMSAADDWTRDIETRGLPELRQIYGLYGKADHVTAKYFPFPHNYNQVSAEMLYDWFNRHLDLGQPTPIRELPFVPVPPKELSVFDAEHPRPKDSLPAAMLREALAKASDEQMAALTQQPDEYRRVVGTALRVLLHDEAPARGSTDAKQVRFEDKGDHYYWYGVQSRKDAGEAVPVLAIVPREPSGKAVVWIHPRGKASLFDDQGQPIAEVRTALAEKAAIIAPDVFLTGEYHLPGKEPTPVPWLEQKHHKDIPFAGYVYGYNRTLLAERVHDILTVSAHLWTRKDVRSVRLVAFGAAGPWGALARAAGGTLIDRAALDLNQFEFNQVQQLRDPMMLPGALKYGGLRGFLGLAQHGRTWCVNAREFEPWPNLPAAPGLQLPTAPATPTEMLRFALDD